MSEWYAKDISKKVKTGIKTKGMSGKPIATEALYGYVKSPDNKDFWIIDEEAAGVVRLIFRLFLDGKNPQPNRRISDAGANPNAHILHERARAGNVQKQGAQ